MFELVCYSASFYELRGSTRQSGGPLYEAGGSTCQSGGSTQVFMQKPSFVKVLKRNNSLFRFPGKEGKIRIIRKKYQDVFWKKMDQQETGL